jgi:aspartyl-tRNA synthetase
MEMLRTHKLDEIDEKNVAKKVKICGWVDSVRVLKSVVFVILRDRYGKVQVVINSSSKGFEEAKNLTLESSILIEGFVKSRPKGQENSELGNSAKVEVEADRIEIYNLSPPLPFDSKNPNTDEDVRMKYRFLDLRNSELQRGLILRHKIIKSFRDYLDKQGFLEIETPLLGASTPEGARDYLVPSRVHKGKFYALPQSPQLYKQLLMVAGYDKYFQVAKCLRDEDLRADRQPEFTQLDVEMSFVDEEDVFHVVEQSIKNIFKEVLGKDLKVPFRRISYEESIKKYKSDKPDLRAETGEEFAFTWVNDFPLFEYSEEEKKIVSAHHPFCMPKDLKDLEKSPLKIKGKTYDLVLNGTELLSGSIRIHIPEIQKRIFKILSLNEKEMNAKFGFLLNAFSYGAPPHGGFAIGLDRFVQILVKAPSIREIIAFPKNKEARDLMLGAPSEVDTKQLNYLGIDIKKKAKK